MKVNKEKPNLILLEKDEIELDAVLYGQANSFEFVYLDNAEYTAICCVKDCQFHIRPKNFYDMKGKK